MADAELFFKDTHNLFTVNELTDVVTGSYVNDATLSAQLMDRDDADIGSPISLVYVVDSNGKYQGVFPNTLVIVDNDQLKVEVTATTQGGTIRVGTLKVRVTREWT